MRWKGVGANICEKVRTWTELLIPAGVCFFPEWNDGLFPGYPQKFRQLSLSLFVDTSYSRKELPALDAKSLALEHNAATWLFRAPRPLDPESSTFAIVLFSIQRKYITITKQRLKNLVTRVFGWYLFHAGVPECYAQSVVVAYPTSRRLPTAREKCRDVPTGVVYSVP